MPVIFQFGRYKIDVDVEKTRVFYASEFSVTTSEACSCDRCQRFPQVIMSCPTTVLDFLDSLGIDPCKAGEVFGISKDKKNDYAGWYHIVGTLLDGQISGVGFERSNAFVPDENVDFQVWFDSDRKRMGWIEKNFPSPILEMSFSAHLSEKHNS